MTTVSINLANLFMECCLSVPRSSGEVERPRDEAGSGPPGAHCLPRPRRINHPRITARCNDC